MSEENPNPTGPETGANPDAGGPPPTVPTEIPSGDVPKDAKTMGMLCHLLGIFLGFIGPLIIWLIKKDEHEFVDDQGKEALNFQLVVLIGYLIGSFTTFVFIGCLIIPAVLIVDLIFCIMGAMKANNGERYRYPLNIRFIK